MAGKGRIQTVCSTSKAYKGPQVCQIHNIHHLHTLASQHVTKCGRHLHRRKGFCSEFTINLSITILANKCQGPIHILYLTAHMPLLPVVQLALPVTSPSAILDMYSGQGAMPDWMQWSKSTKFTYLLHDITELFRTLATSKFNLSQVSHLSNYCSYNLMLCLTARPCIAPDILGKIIGGKSHDLYIPFPHL